MTKKGDIISPTILSNGQCGNGWVCEHRWLEVANMIGFQNVVKNESLTSWWDNNSNQIGFCRGHKGMIFLNGDSYDLISKFSTCLSPGTYCDVISGTKVGNRCTGKSVTIQEDGTATIQVRSKTGILALHVGVSFVCLQICVF